MTYAKTLAVALMLAFLAAGCAPKDEPKKDKKDKEAKKDDHAHGKGPNGGVVFDFGKHHAELTIDHKKKEMSVLILGADEKTPTPIAAKELTVTTKETKGKKGETVKALTVTLKPADEKAGKATKFTGTDDGLAVEAEHTGKLFGDVDGKPAQGTFEE